MKKYLKMIIMFCLAILIFDYFLFQMKVKADSTVDKDVIESLKGQLNEEEREYEYQKVIQEIQENIAILEKQIEFLSQSDAREDRALRLQLEEQLAEEKERLEDEQKKHSMSPEEKEIFEYKKKVDELLKDIANLKHKISVLSLSNERQDIATRLQLEERLKEKEKELEEIEEKHKEEIPTTPSEEETTPTEEPAEEETKPSEESTRPTTRPSGSGSSSSSSSSWGNSTSLSETKTMAEMHVSGREEFEAQFKDNYKYSAELNGYIYSDGYYNSLSYYQEMKKYRETYTEPYATNFDSLVDYVVTGLEMSIWNLPNNVGRIAYNYTRGIVSSEKGILTTTAFPFPSKWCEINGQWTFRYTDGTYPKGQTVFNAKGLAATVYDWEYIDGKWYPFNEYSWLVTGWVYDEAEQAWFYVDKIRGTVSGWQEINKKWYYFEPISNGSKGRMLTSTWIGNFYVNENGVWVQ